MPVRDVCPVGYRYYSCHGNDSNGCFSVNPCSLPAWARSFIPEGSQEDAQASSADTEFPAATTTTSTPPPSKTDSGITHTIPNHSVVTVTKHTVVFSEAPPSTESPAATGDAHTTSVEATAASAAPCSTCISTHIPTEAPSTDASGGGGFPSGAIAGAATGGAVIAIMVLVLVFVSRRRKKRRENHDASESETLGCDARVDGCEKSNPSHVGHLRPNSDPFAPFGGRADRPEHLHRPPSGTFEMDGAGISAVELPAVNISEAPDTSRTASVSAAMEEVSGMAPAPAADPAATLASRSSNPQGGITYVNQWNQYRAMGEGVL
ncbi:hypothetical protein E4U42_000239 [Claviceps africana]|uniref:Uncharacterized protein n=1 Tax=Claviceps africana TaxID=83212 RepID=A0A8K0JGA2_9HYPO|nr:hypothetical protein E4U42_000239 [Claviceps africana]